MRLPAKLLGQVRVGVGVGVVLLTGCDFVDDAKAEVLGEPVVAVATQIEESTTAQEVEPEAPEPMLLGRERGVSGLVKEKIARAETPAESRSAPPIRDLGEPETPEVDAFVPYDDGSGVIASSTVEPRPVAKPRPSIRPRAPVAVDEPCDPEVRPIVKTGPGPGWDSCPACGRG